MDKRKLVLLVTPEEAAVIADAFRGMFQSAAGSGLGTRAMLFRKLFLITQVQRKQWQLKFLKNFNSAREEEKEGVKKPAKKRKR